MLNFREIQAEQGNCDFQLFKRISQELFPVSYNDEVFIKKSRPVLLLLKNQEIGVLSFQTSNQVAYIYTFGIIEKFRGKGIGTLFWEKLESFLIEHCSCSEIFLHVQVTNLKAIHFYKRNGFAILEKIDDYYEGMPCNTAYLMNKCL